MVQTAKLIIGCLSYVRDREDRVSGEMSVTVLHTSLERENVGVRYRKRERE
jgi:hypothetical protein